MAAVASVALVGGFGLAWAGASAMSSLSDPQRVDSIGPLDCPIGTTAFDGVRSGDPVSCLHSDEPPPGVDVTRPASTQELLRRQGGGAAAMKAAEAAAEAAGTTSPRLPAAEATSTAVTCEGDGSDGYRAQAVYTYDASKPVGQQGGDRYTELKSKIQQWAAGVDTVLNRSATLTGGYRSVRWVTEPGPNGTCVPSVLKIAVTSAAMTDPLDVMADQVAAAGHDLSNRKYVMWADATRLCGIAHAFSAGPGVDVPTQDNPNNGSGGPMYSRIDSQCWGRADSTEAHELTHNLGAVLDTAPHHTDYGHCFDESDLMCYDDGPGSVMQQICPTDQEVLLDCNADDYFSTSPTPGSWLATHWNTADSRFLIGGGDGVNGGTPGTKRSGFTAVSPKRFLDTRTGIGAARAKVGAGMSVTLTVPGLPAGATAATFNLTTTNVAATTYVIAYPAGATRPTASNLNVAAGQTVANLVTVAVNGQRQVTFYNAAGTVDLIADLAGYHTPGSGAGFTALSPKRFLDTRYGTGAPKAQLGPGQSITLPVPDLPMGATAATFNLTATRATATTHVIAYPTGATRPTASNLNLTAGQTVANLVTVAVDSQRRVTLYNASGTVDLVADLAGYHTPGSGAFFTAVSPDRFLDTRHAVGAARAKIGPQQSVTVTIPGLPAGTTAATFNLTGTAATANTYEIAHPAGGTLPTASNLNVTAGQTRANLVTVAVSAQRQVTLYNQFGSIDLIADLAGFHTP